MLQLIQSPLSKRLIAGTIKPLLITGFPASRHHFSLPNSFSQKAKEYDRDESVAANHLGRLQNHIWSRDEIETNLRNLYRHEPKTISDHLMQKLVKYSFVYVFLNLMLIYYI
jgi:hypothetical protein